MIQDTKGPATVEAAGDEVGDDLSADGIRALREAMGLSQEAFARKVGVRRATVSDWERGAATPQRIARGVLQRLVDRQRKRALSRASS